MQQPSEVSEDNLSDVRREASRHFRSKKTEYVKNKINEFQSNRIRISETCITAEMDL
jgi:hypothetical protein